MILAQLSDPHVGAEPGERESAEALSAAVEAVLALVPAPDAVILTGDLVDEPSHAAYERVRELLAPLAQPVYVIAGNHDDRAMLREWFPPPAGAPGDAADPYLYCAELPDLRLVVTDSIVPGEDGGRLDRERLEWLATVLAADTDTPTVVAIHHPPVLTSFPAFDEIGIPAADRAGLAGVLAANPQVVRVICGHIHRAFFATLAGCGVAVCPSTWLQSPLEIGMTEIELGGDPPAFMVHATTDDGVVSHVQPIVSGRGREL